MMRISGSGWLLILSFWAYLFAKIEGGRLPHFILYAVTGLLVYALWSARAVAFLSVQRRLEPERCHAGQEVRVITRVTNHAPLPVLWTEVRDGPPDHLLRRGLMGSAATGWSAGLGPLQAVENTTRFVPALRGLYRWESLQLQAGDLFGLSQNQVDHTLPGELLVYPPVADIGRFAPYRVEAAGGPVQWRFAAEDHLSLRSVRDYAAGDALNRVHWKATARTGALKTKEFQRSLPAGGTVIIDGDTTVAAGEGTHSTEEVAVACAAAVVAAWLRNGEPAGLIALDAERSAVLPAPHAVQYPRLLGELARFGSGSNRPRAGSLCLVDELAKKRAVLLPGGLAVLISPRADASLLEALHWLRAEGMRPVLIAIESPDAAEYSGAAPGSGASNWWQQARAAGVPVFTVRAGDDLRLALGGERRVRQA